MIESEENEQVDPLLAGEPLTSRSRWWAFNFGWLAFTMAAVVAVLLLADGIWLAIGLTVTAFFAGEWIVHIPETYGKYRREWERANPDAVLLRGHEPGGGDESR